MDSDQDEAELEARGIADRLGIDFAELKARAAGNAKVKDWNILKQAQYEEFMRAEKTEVHGKAHVQRTDNRQPQQDSIEDVKIDPWVETLAAIEGDRVGDEVRVFSQELITLKLGVPVNDEHLKRLADCMRYLNWEGPRQQRINGKCGRGFFRPVAGRLSQFAPLGSA
jgi:hypothetical protein